jgi:thiamine pyrophosphokinase
LTGAGLILAADGGAQHCRTLGVRPHVVIGDLDSLGAAQRAELEAKGAHIVNHPADKDQTDLELALLYAAQAGANEIRVLAGLGRRWDHSIANLLLVAQDQFASLRILFLDGEQRLFVFRSTADLEAKPGERVSLLALGGDAQGVSTRGLQYPLNAETLAFGSSRGVSNVVVDAGAEVRLASGCLLCVISPGTMD